MTFHALLELVETWSFLLIVWSVAAPALSALAVAGWYEWRYRQALLDERKLTNGLFEKTGGK